MTSINSRTRNRIDGGTTSENQQVRFGQITGNTNALLNHMMKGNTVDPGASRDDFASSRRIRLAEYAGWS